MKLNAFRSPALALLAASAIGLTACGGDDIDGAAAPLGSTHGDKVPVNTPPTSPAPALAVGAKSISARYAVTQIVATGLTHDGDLPLSESGHVVANYRRAGDISSWYGFHWSAATGLTELHRVDGLGTVRPKAVNNAGIVIGSAGRSGANAPMPAAWSASGGTVELPVELLNRNGVAMASAINDAGLIVGMTANWQAGYWKDLNAAPVEIPPDEPRAFSLLFAVNNVGQMVGSRDRKPILWSESEGLKWIPLPDGAISGEAHAVSDSGFVAGQLGYSDLPVTVGMNGIFVRTPEGVFHHVVDGRDVPEARASSGIRLSNDGALILHRQVDGRPFYWSPSAGVRDILGAAGEAGQSRAISPGGTVVGWFQASADARQAAFAWSPAEGFVNLNDRIDPASGLHLDEAVAVTDSGLVLAMADGALILLSPTVQSTAPVSGPIDVADPIAAGAAAAFSVSFTDPDLWDSHTAEWSWGDGTTEAATVSFAEGKGTVTGSRSFAAAGLYEVTLTLRDAGGGSTQSTRQVIVYDPGAGYVAGAGFFSSPAGAYKAGADAAGRAEFTFLARYQGQGHTPLGLTVFRFAAGQMNFVSANNHWLVVSGNRAQFQGSGSVNGAVGHRFELTVIDVDGRGLHWRAQDRIRMKVWSPEGELVYDNQIDPAQQGTPDEGTRIGGGLIEVVTR